MNDTGTFSPSARRAKAVAVCGLVTASLLLALNSHAAQTSTQFNVVVNPQAGSVATDSGSCTLVSAFGNRVFISCGDIRFITNPPAMGRAGESGLELGKTRAVVCWRKVSQNTGDYLEMMLRW